ncbi:NlpC/P60 family protein [Fructilactobacillus sanfranciscensis]|uniref:NlpC/P60 family protein n=1 Tax=Fructilactobacillus sanfranciscensis TaxID=1625 RepID=UPI0023AA4274|nr:NlpC/P60 family protein [Fructilactobacillus sanfranciscensis]WED57314.1 NlpC/P60 family protein [Fructilactobacillus sanfranciscensis]
MKFNKVVKKRFKLYKSGKTWVVAATVFFVLAGMSGLAVHADNTTASSDIAKQTVVANPTNNESPVTSGDDTKQADSSVKTDNGNNSSATSSDDSKSNGTVNHDADKSTTDSDAGTTGQSTDSSTGKVDNNTDNSNSNPAKTDNNKQDSADADKNKTNSDANSNNVNKDNGTNANNSTAKSEDSNKQSSDVPTNNVQPNGWNADHTQYTKDGKLVTGVQSIDGTYYDFDNNHNIVKDDYVESQWGDWYMFGNDGKIATKVTPWSGTYYYFDPLTYLRVDNNYVQSQWGDWYMFGNNGKIATKVTPWSGTYYYFDPLTYLRVDNNYVQSQWGDWYMFGDNGQIVTKVTPWAGTYYYFDPLTYLRVDNSYVQSQWGDWYMFGNDGRIVSGLTEWYGATYYFDPSTYLKVTNTVENINGYYYYFDDSGRLVSWAQYPSDLTADAKATLAIQTASKFLGQGYVQGGNNPQTGFDCSGLVQYAYGVAGVQLPRLSEQQYYATMPIDGSQARRGDLVFFSRTYNDGSNFDPKSMTQVGIYLGNGKMLDAQGNGIVVENVSDFGQSYPTYYGRVLNF